VGGAVTVAAVAIEATTGWRWVWRELVAEGFDVRLAEPVQTRALLGRRRSAKTDRLDARWLAGGAAGEGDAAPVVDPAGANPRAARPNTGSTVAESTGREPAPWGQRLHAYLLHEGWPCSRSNVLRPQGLRWAAALQLREHARLQVDSLLSVMAALEAQLDMVDMEPAVGRSRSQPTIGAVEIFDPFTEGRGLRRINRLEAIAARL